MFYQLHKRSFQIYQCKIYCKIVSTQTDKRKLTSEWQSSRICQKLIILDLIKDFPMIVPYLMKLLYNFYSHKNLPITCLIAYLSIFLWRPYPAQNKRDNWYSQIATSISYNLVSLAYRYHYSWLIKEGQATRCIWLIDRNKYDILW